MKKKSIFKSVLAGTSLLLFATLITSCSKDDDIDPSGSANVIAVNAAAGSSAQTFQISGNTLKSGLAFGQASEYIGTNSGDNLRAEFRTEGSASATATEELDFTNGKHYSVFLAGEGQDARIRAFEDNLDAPASGQTKIRFVHLSDAAPRNVDIRRANGENLITNLEHDRASDYVTVSPGVLSLQVFAAGQNTSLGNFDLSAFAPDKIYTVYVAGSDANNISVHQVRHN
jgi:hypothetical protein